MSKLVKSILAACMLIPGMTLAAGDHSNGYVFVGPDNYMQGTMNVRYNSTVAGTPYIGAQSYAGGTVHFFGRDSENQYFACFVRTTSPIYQAAVDIKNNLQDGGVLYVATSDGSECTHVLLANHSSYQQ